MRISRLMMPAVTLAGALALAACGGGNGNKMDEKEEMGEDPPATCDYGRNADQSCVTKAEFDAAQKETADAAAAVTAAKDRFGNLAGDVLPPSAAPTDNDDPQGQVAKAIGAIKDGSGTAASDDGKVHVTVYELKGMRTKTAEPEAFMTIQANNTESKKDIMGAAFTGTGDEVKHKRVQVGDSYVFRTAGSYKGAQGTYVCTAASAGDCTSRNAGEAGIVLAGGTWTFTASAGEKQYEDDGKYARYGWWLNTGAAGGTSTPQTGAWYSLSTGAAATSVDDSVGTAEYKGKAAGQAALYSARATSGNVGGAFTADVTLTADFNAGGGAGTLEGTIDGFRIGDHSPDWTVELMEKPIGSNAVAQGAANTTHTKWSLGEDDANAAKSGDWRAAFYDQTGTNHPKGVAGGFRSTYGSDGRMVGAFAAEK